MGRTYDPDLLWQTKSGTWSIGLAYEASSIPVMPSGIVARVVIRGARYPVDAIIDASGRVSFGDDVRDVPQYVRDQAAWLLRNKYNRLKGYSEGTDTRRQYAPRQNKPKKTKPEPKPEPPKMVAPPRDSKGRFQSWDDNPYRIKPEGSKKKTKKQPKKSSTGDAPARNAKGQFVSQKTGSSGQTKKTSKGGRS